MAEGSEYYPSVYTLDSHAAPPPLPPRFDRQRRGARSTQTLMSLLVCLALCGMTIEACFIYRLYHPDPVDSPSTHKSTQEKEDPTPTENASPVILPSKPVAHLTDGERVRHGKQTLSWSMDANPLMYKMKYKEGRLVIQTEGYYYIYSKVFFVDTSAFQHSVNMVTPRYVGGHITLLQSRKYIQKTSTRAESNSYLGGVFHLNPGDAVFVSVSNTTLIIRSESYDNYFGAYMI
ncbi:tumor necrosis factor ligand superfamily member 14 [Lampris incognitus]|uniref:tumor necrosis factor ligand superfamily member 14 n=1 Tax=Lampris incognitus TaxID=2546036 RepID=UPI0024B5C265|nr:tumor necrosis factor ligand superfamily member 14 [Lampris incognitus]